MSTPPQHREAPGWDAIDAALAPVVGATQPSHWGTGTRLPDQDGIWGVSAYGLTGHWLFVTYGLTELFVKVSNVPEVSGWGGELTMRVVRNDDVAPVWVAKLLARLGELVYQLGRRSSPVGGSRFPTRPATSRRPLRGPSIRSWRLSMGRSDTRASPRRSDFPWTL